MTERVLLLDGGMGSMIQSYGLQGNNDMFCLEHPEVIAEIHRRYLEAGADLLTTCTFNAQRISQQEYHTADRIADINRAAVRLARREADRMTAQTPDRPRFVLGDIGPTNKMLSMSDDVQDPAARSITFDELEAVYMEQIQVLVEEGVDGILIETIFDTANAKAALSAFDKVKTAISEERGADWKAPEVILSMTVNDASGRTLSGQVIEAFVISVLHAKPLAVGLNCGLGADGMLPYLRRMSACAPCFVSCHPNAGLPNQFGGYDDTPEEMCSQMQPMIDERLVNMIGGCCGTTPEHIAEMRRMLDANLAPRPLPVLTPAMRLAGLEPLVADDTSFIKVGERCNVAGSRKFLRLINEKQYEEALDIARKQVEDGAMVIDVNMDDGLLDARQEMRTFLNLLASDPAISRVPVMVDSSRWEVIEEGLKCLQGKGIVNSISLKMGEEEFIEHARVVRRLGAAVIMMNFDEEGQATDYESRVRISSRAFRILTEQVGFDPTDIIFDPNILTVATGMAEHSAYASDFIRATRWIHDHLQGTRISGGLSNLSFAFRGNNYLREAMHSVFLHHAIPQGMGMAIMNPAAEVDYFRIPAELTLAITEVVHNTFPEAAEQLIEMAQRMNDAQARAKEAGEKYNPTAIFRQAGTVADIPTEQTQVEQTSPAPSTPEERLQQALIQGVSTTLNADLQELLQRGDKALDIISGPLMDGMNTVGTLFGSGKMFLPQVVKTARTMKKAVEFLDPYIKEGKSEAASIAAGKLVLATVKGDVHDIGKNIVGVILACNNFEVVDLGVMVPADKIIATAIETQADFISLSGLITPSLEEMCHVATAMQEAGLTIPLIVGGATTSPVHTAVKIAPCYSGPVFHVRDAATNPGLLQKLLDPNQKEQVVTENRAEQQRLREAQVEKVKKPKTSSPEEDLANRWTTDWEQYTPVQPPFLGERRHADIPVRELLPLIDWLYFYWPWRVKAESEEGQKLRADADLILQEIADDPRYAVRLTQAFYPAVGLDQGIRFQLRRAHDAGCPCCNREMLLPTPRQEGKKPSKSLCDFVSPKGDDFVGAFAATVSQTFVDRLEKLKETQGNSDYDALLLQTLGDRLAEAAAEYASHELLKYNQWGGIRPAVGYPSLPDQKAIFQLAELIDFRSIGISLTENGAMYPQASVSGLYFSHPEADYFSI